MEDNKNQQTDQDTAFDTVPQVHVQTERERRFEQYFNPASNYMLPDPDEPGPFNVDIPQDVVDVQANEYEDRQRYENGNDGETFCIGSTTNWNRKDRC